MPNYIIVTDATADLPQALMEEYEIGVVPMECRLGDKTYIYEPTHQSLSVSEFYAVMREGAETSTSQINVFAYTSFFTPLLESGRDILYIAFSSGLTGSQQSALLAIEELAVKFPERRILMIDSLCASLGEGLLVCAAGKKRKEGMDMDALHQWVKDNMLKLCHWFTVDDLKYLLRGGRISSAAAFFGTALRIKPVLHVDNTGHLVPLTKVQGRKRALKELVENMVATYLPDENEVIFIGHADAPEDAAYVKRLVEERLHLDSFVVDYIGPIIGAHSGPGTIALFHFGTHR